MFSFLSDSQMVIDATILITRHPPDTPDTKTEEVLHPQRHKMTLPLNSLNNYFQSCEVAVNYHTKLDSDR